MMQCDAGFLVNSPVIVGPGTRIAQLRQITSRDEKILRCVHQAEDRELETRRIMASVHAAAHQEALQTVPPPDSATREKVERFLKTSYKTRGRKQTKAELFPQLQKEIAQEKEKI